MNSRPVFESIGAWVAEADAFSPRVFRNAKRGILDVIGVSLAAGGEPLAPMLRTVYQRGVSSSGVPIVGQNVRTSAQTAAAWNGALAHALDFDDSSSDWGGHPSAVVFSAAFALADELAASGRDLLEAYAVGFEVTAALGRALNPEHYDSGWHPTATLGAFGAAAACGRLLGLSATQQGHAMSLTSALCSGLKASFGTLAKPVQVGRAAMNGVLAAQLVHAGVDAHADSFEGKHGFLAVIHRTSEVPRVALPSADPDTWSLVNPGIIIKQYPCCGSTHSAADLAVDLHREIPPGDIRRVTVGLHPKRLAHVNRPNPRSGLDSKFSVQYVVARGLLDGQLRLNHFVDSAINEPQVRQLMSRISAVELEAPDDVVEDRYVAAVSVTTSRAVHEVQIPMARGREPGVMLADEAIFNKFSDCSRAVLGPERETAVRSMVLNLEDVPDVRALGDLLLTGSSDQSPDEESLSAVTGRLHPAATNEREP